MQIFQVGKFYHPAKGGMESHLRELATCLGPHATIQIAVAGKRRSALDVVDGIGIERFATWATILGTPICPGLVARFRQTNSDIVHIHWPNPWAVVAYLASGCSRTLVVTYHSDIVRQSFVEPAFRPLLVKFLKRASAIICSSPNLIEHSRILRRFRDRCVVIPFGVDLKSLNKADPAVVRAIAGSYQRPIILSVGRLVYYKGFEYLIAAMAHVDGHLIIIGKGSAKTRLLRLGARLGISDRLTILDEVDDPAPFYHAAHLFVLPSVARSEAFGIVQIEAMAAGKPVVNTQLDSGVPFVSQHGITGLTVPPADKLALAKAINRLLSDADLRRRCGLAAKLRAQQEFSVDTMIARTLQIYDHVMTAPGRPIAHAFAEKAAAAVS